MIARLSIALLLAATVTVAAFASPAAVAAPEAPLRSISARYTLDVSVDDQHHVVDARETVEATNRTSAKLTSLVFNVTPRHFEGFQMGKVDVDGAVQQPRFDDVVMEVPLPSPLAPDDTTKVTLSFKETVPSPGNVRYGASGDILVLGNWFPILAVYGPTGWDRHHYTAVGDPFFTETADYHVTLHTDPHVVTASTGVVTKHQGGVWEISASGVRDFALAMSRRYQSHSATVAGTRITSYYLPEDKTGGADALEYARQSLAWYTQHLGPYGYPTFAVAEVSGEAATDAGQDYPNVIFVSSAQEHHPSPRGEALTYLVARETGHQWFYGLVGNDQVHQPWLDEGPAVELSYLFLKDQYPAEYFTQWSHLESDYETAVANWGQKTLDSTADDYGSEDEYTGLLDRQSAIFLEHLREAMGTDNYFNFLRDYVATYRGEVATTRGFLSLAERYAGHDLSDLYKDYFRPKAYSEAAPTVAATVVATATAVPTATVIPSPSPAPEAADAASTPSVAASSPVVEATVAAATPAAGATQNADSSSGGLGTTLALVGISSFVGLVLVAMLSFLLLRRQS